MSTEVVTLKMRRGGCGGKYFTQMPGCFRVSREEILELIKNNEVKFDGGEGDHLEILSSLKAVEGKNGKADLLLRIIRHDGFIEYIDYLERIA